MAEMIGNLIFLWGDNSMNERLKPCPVLRRRRDDLLFKRNERLLLYAQ